VKQPVESRSGSVEYVLSVGEGRWLHSVFKVGKAARGGWPVTGGNGAKLHKGQRGQGRLGGGFRTGSTDVLVVDKQERQGREAA